jgi:hypothetical protein
MPCQVGWPGIGCPAGQPATIMRKLNKNSFGEMANHLFLCESVKIAELLACLGQILASTAQFQFGIWA